ncbi:hypothetical protein FRB99_008430 [Tulasnella sp. 403]|nr:hypothetical protein FRB99_008430 [Tulasnella sp. 403]
MSPFSDGGNSPRRGEPIHEDFVSTQATAVYTAIQACWSHHVYIPELAHRFWRLTLQILSRYKTWLDTNLPPRELPTSVTAALASDKASLARSATPVPSNPTSTAEASVADQTTLLRFASAFIDVCAMERRILYLWQSEISILLPDSTTEEDAGNNEAVLKASVSALTELLPDIATQIIIILTRRCSEALSLVRSIAFQYRAMNKKRDPTGPSEYVPNILQPVRQFLEQDGLAEFISDSDRKNWVTQVFGAVCIKYTAYLDAMKQTEESLRRYKKGKISAFSLFGGGSSRENEESKDEERVRAQMVLDVEALGQDARRLGVETDAIEAYATLKATAASSGE